MNSQPLVSVVCLCHNQERFVAQAIQSVWDQTYDFVELIVVDDGSVDSSKKVITENLKGHPVTFISLDQNVGNCAAFNQGFRKSKGQFVIDLAADDILLPNRIIAGITCFSDPTIGVNFSDAYLIKEAGGSLGTHYSRNKTDKLLEKIPDGDIYLELIQHYFICPPTMMIRREVLEELDGYDENLVYEDFDFWIRSSRNWKYKFIDEVLVQKREVKNSHSQQQFRMFSKHQGSTLAVCKKIKTLNKNEEEDKALRKRCWYEIRQCIRQGNLSLIPAFLRLL